MYIFYIIISLLSEGVKMTVPKVSIIVPIYNAEKYLEKCIRSIQEQTLKDIEIILVNDGSLDNSLDICMQYQKKDNRIEVIDQPNGGVSSARNAGLQIAKGEYIGFVDPDDWIDEDMYGNLYSKVIESQSDIIMCNYVIEKGEKSIPQLLNIDMHILGEKEIREKIILNMIAAPSLNSGAETIMGSVWRLVIRNEFVKQHNFSFDQDIPLMEDLVFCIQILLASERLVIDSGTYYHYMMNPESAMNSYRENIKTEQQMVINRLEEILEEYHLLSDCEDRLSIRYVNMILSAIVNEVHRANRKKFVAKSKKIKYLCKDTRLKGILQEINIKGYTIRKKLILNAVNLELSIVLYFYYYFFSIFRKLTLLIK